MALLSSPERNLVSLLAVWLASAHLAVAVSSPVYSLARYKSMGATLRSNAFLCPTNSFRNYMESPTSSRSGSSSTLQRGKACLDCRCAARFDAC